MKVNVHIYGLSRPPVECGEMIEMLRRIMGKDVLDDVHRLWGIGRDVVDVHPDLSLFMAA